MRGASLGGEGARGCRGQGNYYVSLRLYVSCCDVRRPLLILCRAVVSIILCMSQLTAQCEWIARNYVSTNDVLRMGCGVFDYVRIRVRVCCQYV